MISVVNAYLDLVRSNLSDYVLLQRFKYIRYQCKWGDRSIDTLLEYINELEYRGISYRL